MCDCERQQAANEYSDCTIHVHCDDWCGALRDPTTIEEYRKALEHWQSHGYLGGCSHAN